MFHLSLTLRFGREPEESEWPDYREVDMGSQAERAEPLRDEIGFRYEPIADPGDDRCRS